ncbi:MAG: tyrosine-type recombinase/integrase [bacterium]
MITDITIYQFGRHSVASQAVNNGIPLNLIGSFLSHSDTRTTKRYSHLNLDGLKKMVTSRKEKGKVIKLKKDNLGDRLGTQ